MQVYNFSWYNNWRPWTDLEKYSVVLHFFHLLVMVFKECYKIYLLTSTRRYHQSYVVFFKNMIFLLISIENSCWPLKSKVHYKVENILKDSLDSIPSPSPSVKIQIMGKKVCLRCKGKTLQDVFKKLLKTRSLLIYYLKKTFLSNVLIFMEGEGDDGIESRLSSYIFSTLPVPIIY